MSLLVVAVLAAAAALVWRPEIAAIVPPPAQGFDRSLVKQGEILAHLGGCRGCHTVQDGKPFAGGRPLQTPIGMVFATNITPSVDTGIGSWSREAFSIRLFPTIISPRQAMASWRRSMPS
jgi:hypothetical protein